MTASIPRLLTQLSMSCLILSATRHALVATSVLSVASNTVGAEPARAATRLLSSRVSAAVKTADADTLLVVLRPRLPHDEVVVVRRGDGRPILFVASTSSVHEVLAGLKAAKHFAKPDGRAQPRDLRVSIPHGEPPVSNATVRANKKGPPDAEAVRAGARRRAYAQQILDALRTAPVREVAPYGTARALALPVRGMRELD